jgi:hypothetical protein
MREGFAGEGFGAPAAHVMVGEQQQLLDVGRQ